MKYLIRLYDDDLRKLVAQKYNVPSDNVISTLTEEVMGYGMEEHVEPVFYIDVELNVEEEDG